MNLKEFLKEESNARKKRRLDEKKSKKKNLSPEQKRYRIFSTIFLILIIFGCLFFCCNDISNSGYDWNKVVGIDAEMQTKLTKSVNIENLFFEKKIGSEDYTSCKQKFLNVGIDLENKLADMFPTSSFEITDREIGIFAFEMSNSLSGNIEDIYACDIYIVGESVYQKSVVKVNLSKFILGANLPYIFLTTTSKIEILSKKICVVSSEVIINELTLVESNSVVSAINKNYSQDLKSLGNNLIISYINLMATAINVDMTLLDGGIKFLKIV